MIIEFPDLKGKDKETLYIIGNGFDLSHGVKSSYIDFYCWLKKHGYDNFINCMERLFPLSENRNLLLWQDFERALGQYDSAQIHESFFEGNDDGFWDIATQKKTLNRIEPIIKNIKPLMKLWAKDINITKIEPKMDLSVDSLYLTFNYTKILEEVYKIPTYANNICHIHGCIDDKDDLIVGHNVFKDTNTIFDKNENKEYSHKYITSLMNQQYKRTDEIISHHSLFFDSLENVSRVVVLGHSLSSIDRPYIIRVLRNISSNAHWHFSKHSENDEMNIASFIHKQLCKPEKRWIFNY